MSVNGPISPKQCYYEMDYSFYLLYWLDSLEIRLDHNSTYYRSLSKNSDVKPRTSHCDSQNLQYKTHPEFLPHRRIFKRSLYYIYKTRLILETRRQLTIVRLLPAATKDIHMKFETEIPKQTWVTLPKPCHTETEKSDMATRQPFRKWGHWKSIGSYPYT